MSRQDLARWLADTLGGPESVLVGLDHAFSFPREILEGAGVTSWDEFLRWFTARWPTHERSAHDAVEERPLPTAEHFLRLADRWTPSAKSIFARIGPGVFHSTLAGIPWLAELREALGDRLHV